MNLSAQLRIDAAYTRSINLERDWESSAELSSYVPTPRACETLRRFLSAQQPTDQPRAWALIGPYGSGKSAFALFLAKLISRPGSPAAQSALRTLRAADSSLAIDLHRLTSEGLGYCTVLLTGSPEPLAKRFLLALERAAVQFWSARKGRQPQVINRIRVAVELEDFAGTEILALVRELQAAVGRAGGRGLLVVIDELGKFLEYEARHRDANDIYLLQVLAEAALRSGEAPLNVFVLLHQAFEQYAAGISDQLKNEWKKVQGRFEGIPFVESAEQVMRVISAAVHASLDAATQQRLSADVEGIAQQMAQAGALPGPMSLAAAQELFEACYPLHPISLVLLPTLAQKVAQNERTIFSYLGGQEPHGFADTVSRLGSMADDLPWVMPWHIFDYFVSSQAGLLSDPLTHRRWAEVVTALERLGDAPTAEMELLKTIGLFNLAGVQGGFKASPDIVRLCFAHQEIALESAIAGLEKRSLITFRKFSGEYRVWQGSDFDLEEALNRERGQVGAVALAETLNQRRSLSALVARRYSIETGTLRYFAPRFVDHDTHLNESDVRQPTLLVCLAMTPAEVERFQGLAAAWGNPLGVLVVCRNGAELRDAVAEVMAIQRVQRNSPQLGVDPVAQREVRDRLTIAMRREAQLLADVLDEPAAGVWYRGGQVQRVEAKRDVQALLSGALHEAYPLAPIIHNELINRDRPSSSANAGRNKLVQAMLERPGEDGLGIERFPAEKAMYLSLLRSTGIHRAHAGKWRFEHPAPEVGARNDVGHVWTHIEAFLDRTEADPLSIGQLFDELQAPPYGVKAGVLPILFLAACHAYRDEIALYDQGLFSPFVGLELVERLMRNPGAFSVQRVRLGGIRDAVFKKYAEAITGEEPEEASLLNVVKPLARFMAGLPDYTKKTRSVSAEAQAVRELFFEAKSPTELLLRSLPKACGFEPLAGTDKTHTDLEAFSRKLAAVLIELRAAYHGLLQHLLTMLRQAFALDAKVGIEEVRSRLRGRYAGLQDYTIDVQGLRAFLGRLTDDYGDDTQWLVSVASFLGRKPPEKWSSEDVRAAEYKLVEYARRMRDLERLRISCEGHKTRTSGEFDVILLRTVRQGVGEAEETVVIDEQTNATVGPTYRSLRAELLARLPDEESRLAVVAKLLDEMLRKQTIATRDADQGAMGKEVKRD